MTDKELLLKDLCARLPYGVFCNMGLDYPLPLQRLFIDKLDGILLDFYKDGKDYQVYLSEVKPYLRPMSSMTEEEKGELWFLLTEGRTNIELNSNGQLTTRENIELGFNYPFVCPEGSILYVDWLNKNHFDYRGLIPNGSAIEVTKDNNPYESSNKTH